MPELPEVETTRAGILPHLEHQTLSSLSIRNGALRWPVPELLYKLKDQVVTAILRRGKYIIIEYAEGAILVHLGMSGSLRVVDDKTPIQKHDHVDFNIGSGKIIRFNDPRRFGSVLWSEHWQTHKLIASLGPEPLDKAFDVDYLYQAIRKKGSAIKLVIMDSHVVVGVGNIYANEALFLSGINPKQAANKVSKQRIAELVIQIKHVLNAAIQQGGTTLKDFVNSDGKPGYFKQQLHVYGRAGEPCTQCQTPLTEFRMSNRSTVFCKKCQR